MFWPWAWHWSAQLTRVTIPPGFKKKKRQLIKTENTSTLGHVSFEARWCKRKWQGWWIFPANCEVLASLNCRGLGLCARVMWSHQAVWAHSLSAKRGLEICTPPPANSNPILLGWHSHCSSCSGTVQSQFSQNHNGKSNLTLKLVILWGQLRKAARVICFTATRVEST